MATEPGDQIPPSVGSPKKQGATSVQYRGRDHPPTLKERVRNGVVLTVLLNVIVFIQPNHSSLSGWPFLIGPVIAELLGFALSIAVYQLMSGLTTAFLTGLIGYTLILVEA